MKWLVICLALALTIVIRNSNPKILAIKLLFLLIFKNILKNIATVLNPFLANVFFWSPWKHQKTIRKKGLIQNMKYENMVSYNTGYIFPDLIDWKADWKANWTKKCLYLWKILYRLKLVCHKYFQYFFIKYQSSC